MNGLLWYKRHEKKEEKIVLIKFDTDKEAMGINAVKIKGKMDLKDKRFRSRWLRGKRP